MRESTSVIAALCPASVGVQDPDGTYSNESTCESECHAPQDKYRCVDDKCEADAAGGCPDLFWVSGSSAS